jgi:hypothetical protein
METASRPMTIPGAFALDYDDDSGKPIARATLYMPPSPSASSVLSHSISRTQSYQNSQSRKRPRLETTQNHHASTPYSLRRTDTSTTTFSLDAPSPAPLTNIDYRLAANYGTPINEKVQHEDWTPQEFEEDLRQNRYAQQRDGGYFPHTPSSRVVKRRFSASPRGSPGWGHTVWQYTGGVAGKVINFCWTKAFNGFHAGGGQGYTMSLETPTVTGGDATAVNGSRDVFDDRYRARVGTPVPGGYPEENFIEDYMSRPQSHQQHETPTQFNDVGDRSSLRGNWVMVNEPYTDTEHSPVRKKARSSTASRPSSRPSTATRPKMPARISASGASYASPRGSAFSTTQHTSRPTSSDGFVRQHKRSRSSIAHARQPDLNSEHNTPRSPEVVKFESKMRKRDQRQDRSIHRINQQIQDLIKEGQQTLGSRVEVDDEVDDEGYEEGREMTPEFGRW